MTHKPIPHSTVSRLERADAVVSQVVMFTKWGHRLVTKMSFSKAFDISLLALQTMSHAAFIGSQENATAHRVAGKCTLAPVGSPLNNYVSKSLHSF